MTTNNKVMLEESGISPNASDTLRFVSGVFLSLQQACHTVSLLQSVCQADAAHMNLGKYTLYSAMDILPMGTHSLLP